MSEALDIIKKILVCIFFAVSTAILVVGFGNIVEDIREIEKEKKEHDRYADNNRGGRGNN